MNTRKLLPLLSVKLEGGRFYHRHERGSFHVWKYIMEYVYDEAAVIKTPKKNLRSNDIKIIVSSTRMNPEGQLKKMRHLSDIHKL